MHSLPSIESIEPNYRPKIPLVKCFNILRVIPQLHSGARGPGVAYSFLALQHGDFVWHDWAHGRGAFHK